MAKKALSVIPIVIITALAILFLTDSGNERKAEIESTFQIDAIYYEPGYVEILFSDTTAKTNSVVMEILGMEETFQKSYDTFEFIEIVEFPNPPKYGWQIHPVTFEITHPDLGNVSLKTEIHPLGEPKPPIIYGVP